LLWPRRIPSSGNRDDAAIYHQNLQNLWSELEYMKLTHEKINGVFAVNLNDFQEGAPTALAKAATDPAHAFIQGIQTKKQVDAFISLFYFCIYPSEKPNDYSLIKMLRED
jgi:hypothetical protein